MAIRRRVDKDKGGAGIVLPSSGADAPARTTVDGAPPSVPGGAVATDTATGAVVAGGVAADTGRRPIGEILVEKGVITSGQLQGALGVQAAEPDEGRRRLGELLVAEGVVRPAVVVEALAQQYGLSTISMMRTNPETTTVVRLPRETADHVDALAIRQLEEGVLVAVGDPTFPDLEAILSAALGDIVTLVVAVPDELHRSRAEAYEAAEGMGDIIRAFDARQVQTQPEETGASVQVDENAPIIQVVTRIIERAVADRASDVHIEPMENRVRVRNRIDGALKEVLSLPTSMSQALTSRIKIMAGLNIVERRRPQDGQIETVAGGRTLDIRVSTAGTVFGESTVLRILDRKRALYGLHDLGMPTDVEERYREIIQSPYGLVVCAGPTGSGKTTTLYTTLQAVKSDEINVMTVEDPVEYVFPDINQMSINEQAGITFAGGLRAILRQDPDTILVGEIRDIETARIAIQAALTGHFVLSTVHATDAASALHRFIDMGIEPFLLSSALLATVGQRLVRQNCEHCSAPYDPTPEELAFYDKAGGQKADDGVFRKGQGCDACSGTGYYGRVGVYEVLRMTDEIRDRVIDHAQADEIRKLAEDDGMVSMHARAVGLIDDGISTIAEVMRTVYVV